MEKKGKKLSLVEYKIRIYKAKIRYNKYSRLRMKNEIK